MNEVDQLAVLCQKLGARPPQDKLMARQLLKRAEQIAVTRGINKLEALQHLLSLLRSGAREDVGGDSAPQKGSERTDLPKKFDNRQENR